MRKDQGKKGLEEQLQYIVVLIPAFNPDQMLLRYVEELQEVGLKRILLVDDGSREACQEIFRKLQSREGVMVLRHEQNKGKGRALKTGFAWCLAHCPDCLGVVTADSDGQHTPQDTKSVALELLANRGSLVLGSRNFRQKNIPPKSLFGNRLTSRVFALLYGVYLQDTQTGLRGIDAEQLTVYLELPGERFEYEIRMLMDAARRHTPVREVSIETIYRDGNRETHFDPLWDSWKIYRVMLGSFLRYVLSSLSSFLLDMAVFSLFSLWILRGMGLRENIFYSTVAARAVSSFYNFMVNQKLVFHAKGHFWRRAAGYYALAVCQMGCSAGLVYLLTKGCHLPSVLCKGVVDTVLFLVSYQIQRRFIFSFVDKQGKLCYDDSRCEEKNK